MTSDNNDIRHNIDSLFDEEEKIVEPIVLPADKKAKSQEIKEDVVEDEASTFAISKALEEMELIRQAFLEFQESVSGCVVLEYLYEELEEFANACMDMVELIENDIKTENLSPTGQAYYTKMQKFRTSLLSAMLKKYKD